MKGQLQSIKSRDIYFVCQMVDTILKDDTGAYIRNIEDFLGDMSSSGLARTYPKWTSLHNMIEVAIYSVIYEDADKLRAPGDFWIDNLLSSNGLRKDVFRRSIFEDRSTLRQTDGWQYLEGLAESGLIEQVCDTVTKQAFHIMFSNRSTLAAFWETASHYVLDVAPTFAPDAFTTSGTLKRKTAPSWAKQAVFHRDKGRCVICTTDLTKIINTEEALHFDHIVPLANGGGNCVTNLQLLCADCNIIKGARSSKTSSEYTTWYAYD